MPRIDKMIELSCYLYFRSWKKISRMKFRLKFASMDLDPCAFGEVEALGIDLRKKDQTNYENNDG